jgi:hypothetical protein
LRVRAALSLLAVLLVLVTAVAPHVHAGDAGRHGCVACVVSSSGCEEAGSEIPEVGPPPEASATIPSELSVFPVTGRPLGAVPGQSPPADL